MSTWQLPASQAGIKEVIQIKCIFIFNISKISHWEFISVAVMTTVYGL